jgi:hypothetical protein
MADINLQGLRTSTYKGFIEFKDPDGSTYYRIKERQNATLGFSFSYSEHYTDSGFKSLDPTGYNHSFDMTLKVTSDMIDDVTSSGGAPNDKKTISYWIYKASQMDPIDLVFVAKQEALAEPSGQSSNEKHLWYKFKVRLTSFTTAYGTSGGSQNWDLRGIITEINAIERTTSGTTEPSATTNWQTS